MLSFKFLVNGGIIEQPSNEASHEDDEPSTSEALVQGTFGNFFNDESCLVKQTT